MAIKSFFTIIFAAIGGIYLTSDEGKKARDSLRKKKSIFQPIIQDLIKQANEVLEGSEKINSEKIRFNIDKLIKEAKKVLLESNLDKTTNQIKLAIKVASKKILEAFNEKNLNKTKKITPIKKRKN